MLHVFEKIIGKINEIIAILIIVGLVFLIFGILTIIHPAIIVYLFIIGFGILAALSFIAAERVYRIKHLIKELMHWLKK